MSDSSGTTDDSTNTSDDSATGTTKRDGLGSEGTIPNEPGSVGVGAGEPTTFEPEEDPEAAANRDDEAPTERRSDKGIGSDPAPDVGSSN